MSINDVTYFDTGRHAFVPRLLGIVRRLVASYLACRQQLADIATLRSMSDRELKDFGVYRGDLDRIADDARRAAIDSALRARAGSTPL
jgi:uncharacterized protein YjiS (DUF1127 family)